MDNEITVLIVEDEGLIAQNIKMQLESFGYHVAGVCTNYSTAWKAAAELPFDVLLTDINLGNGIDEKSGLQIAHLVKETKDCPIIFLTAFSDKDTIKKATALSPSGYLVKPINAANLFATVQLAVNNFRSKKTAQHNSGETPDYFFIKQGSKLYKLYWRDVYHLEHVKNYVKIHAANHNGAVLVRGSLNQVLQNMIPDAYKGNFIRINRAEVISKKIISSIDKHQIETDYGIFKISSGFEIGEL